MDDLRTSLGCYGDSEVKSPNIDNLASRAMLFERAYCQVAVCSPSRTSLLTGRRPDTTHVWLISPKEYWRLQVNATTIPQYFKEHGYISIGMGKVFHPGAPNGNDDQKYSWSPEGLPYYHSPLEKQYGPSNKTSLAWAFEGFEDNQLPDGQIAENALDVLSQLKENATKGDERPFFLAVGFHKPHTPFYSPKKYFDLYPPAESISSPENPLPPTGMPDVAWSDWGAIKSWDDIKALFKDKPLCVNDTTVALTETCMMPVDKAKELRRAYYAGVSYSDAQVGKVIQKMESLGYGNDTIIVLWGDHGWQLGEHGEWAKFTNFEDATHVPFILRVPGVTDSGMKTQALVELIDIFPSLTELAGLPVPEMCPKNSKEIEECVEGSSVAPLLSNPTQKWKQASFSQYPRPASGFSNIPGKPKFLPKNSEQVMGYTMRVEGWRYTEWLSFNHTAGMADWDTVWGVELYNHSMPAKNFNDENTNLAANPALKDEVSALHSMLKEGWRSALPPPPPPKPSAQDSLAHVH